MQLKTCSLDPSSGNANRNEWEGVHQRKRIDQTQSGKKTRTERCKRKRIYPETDSAGELGVVTPPNILVFFGKLCFHSVKVIFLVVSSDKLTSRR